MKNNIGSNIQRLRKERDLTQHAFAAKLGVTAQAVSKWETGTGMPDINFLPEIAKLLGVSIDVLFEHYDEDETIYVDEEVEGNVESEESEEAEATDSVNDDPNFTYENVGTDYSRNRANRYEGYFTDFFSDGMFNSEKIEEFLGQVKEDVRSSLAKGFNFDVNSSYDSDGAEQANNASKDTEDYERCWEASEAEWEDSEREWEESERKWEESERKWEEAASNSERKWEESASNSERKWEESGAYGEDWEEELEDKARSFEERVEAAAKELERDIEATVSKAFETDIEEDTSSSAEDAAETGTDSDNADASSGFTYEHQEITKPEYNDAKHRLELTGEVKTLTLELSGANKFYISKAQDNVSSLRIEATDKVLEEITLSHKNGDLAIRREKSVKTGSIFNFSLGNKERAIFYLELIEEHLELLKLRISGASDLTSELNARVVDSKVSGAGDVKLKDAHEVNSIMSGAGDLTLVNVGNIHSETSGAGDVSIQAIHGNALFKVSGASSIKVGECHMQDLTLRFSGAADFRSKASVNNLTVRASGAVSDISIKELRGKQSIRGMKLSKVRIG